MGAHAPISLLPFTPVGINNRSTIVKYTKVGNEVSIYLVRDDYTLCVGAEVIYCDESIKNFLENVEEIPSDAKDATVIE